MRALILFAVVTAALPGLADVVAVDDLGRLYSSTGKMPDGVRVGDKEFASGFHKIQSMAWHGRDLWVSNAPDLTIAKDVDGDGVADEYVLMGRSLGDEQHGLHGIAWGADGRLYMATDEPGLMPAGQLGRPMMYHKDEYVPVPFRRASVAVYEGAIWRCDADGRGLEVAERGWAGNLREIGFDDAFHLTHGPSKASTDVLHEEKRQRFIHEWTFEELAGDLGHGIAARSVAAQEELLRRGESIKVGMLEWLKRDDLTKRQRTWALWTLGRAGKDDVEIEAWFAAQPARSADQNTRIQCLRIIAFRMREFAFTKEVPESVVEALRDPAAEVRKQAVETLGQVHQRLPALLDLLAAEAEADIRDMACRILAGTGDAALLNSMRDDPRPLVRAALQKAMLGKETR